MEKRRKYFVQFVASIAAVMVAFVLSYLLAAILPLSPYSPWRTALASIPLFLPALFVGLTVARAVAHALSEMDELQQRIQQEAFAFSLAGTATLAFALGLAQVMWTEYVVSLVFVPLMAAAFWGIGLVQAKRRYQ
jgi:hypothetical protein